MCHLGGCAQRLPASACSQRASCPHAGPSSWESPNHPLGKCYGSAVKHTTHTTWVLDQLCSTLAVPSRTRGLFWPCRLDGDRNTTCCTRLCRALDGGLPKDMSTSQTPEPVNVTSFGKRSLQIFLLRNLRRDHPGLPSWALNPMTSVLMRDGRGDTEKRRGLV